jgi:hypothetical protein
METERNINPIDDASDQAVDTRNRTTETADVEEPCDQLDVNDPRYRWGFMARRQHGDRDWEAVEPELQSAWEEAQQNDSSWENVKVAVRCGWDRAQDAIGVE